jgi:acyl carrier protein
MGDQVISEVANLPRVRLPEIESRVCDIACDELGLTKGTFSVNARLLQDLGCDSLDLVELFMAIEEAFSVTLPDKAPNPVYKAVFTRKEFRLADLAELVYLQQGSGKTERTGWRRRQEKPPTGPSLPFSQLDGRLHPVREANQNLLEPLKSDSITGTFRRRTDGMRCILIPSAAVEIGSDAPYALSDERPKHVVEIDSFLIDAEPVSTTAYCRFLNSVGETSPEVLADWFVLPPADDRNQHLLIASLESEWRPVPGTERWPMMLVSWYGANAYSLWANGRDWKNYWNNHEEDTESFLPTEAQWEYSARGERYQPFPWGAAEPSQELMRYGQHYQTASYRAAEMPLVGVNELIGMSPFGLHQMGGNIWQWCRDWYELDFYVKQEAIRRNPLNRTPTGVKSERGGSWVGPAELCRSSFRRGRPPSVRGRCLGFRCVSLV